ncbi:MAG: T9SS type A sorting domain-containing protein [Phycisphaerae bacterium]|nr:T9SS type A sorting domain-containing protein [Saprospiraceae bacterium]
MKKVALCLTLAIISSFLSAQSVILDSAFGVNGKVATNMTDSYGNPYGNNVVLLPNGEVVAIGAVVESTFLAAVEKFENNGALDSSFTQIFPQLSEYNYGLSAQLDGKLLVTGYESSSPFHGSVFRLNADGRKDTTFGTGGLSSLLVNIFDNIIPMEVSTGKIVVFGDEDIPGAGIRVFAARLHLNGEADTSFGENGYFRFDLPNKYLLITAGLEQPDGKLLFAGMAHWELFMIRLNQDGTRDLSFGTDGYLIDPMPSGGEAYGLALQPDGKMVVCGYGDPSYQPIVARYHPNGSLDTSFGDQGIVYYTDIPEDTEGIGIEVLPNGKTIVGISSFYGKNFYIAQLLPNGARDTTFGENGVFEYANSDFRARAMSLRANMLAVSGREESSSGIHKILLLRFLLDLNVGTINPATAEPSLWVYPNPIAERFNLKFGLTQKEQVSIRLFDMNGKEVQSFVQTQSFEAGEHEINLFCADHLSTGNYVLTVQIDGKKVSNIQIMKK